MRIGLNGPIINMFLNDIKIMALKKAEIIQYIKSKLITTFSILDISPISIYLGLKVEQNRENQIIKLFHLA